MRNWIPDVFLRGANRFYPDGSLRSIVTLSSGSVIGHVILAATSPIISRLYTPDEFGLFSIFFSVFGIISILSTLQYQNTITLPRSDNDGAKLLVASLLVLATFTVCLLFLVSAFGERIGGRLGLESDYRIIWFLPIALAVANANLCLQFWFLRKKEYKELAIVKGVQSVAMAGGQITMGLAGLGALGLIVGHLLGQMAGILQLTTGIFSRYRAAFGEMRLLSLLEILWQNRSFVTTFTPAALLGAGTIYLPAILLGFLFGPAVAGVFAFGLQLSKAGINIVVQSVARVFLVSSSEDFNNEAFERIKRRAVRFAWSQFLLGAPVFAVLVLFGGEIFGFVFGPSWTLAGDYVGLLVPHLATLFVFEHLVTLFVVTGTHKSKLLWDSLKFLVLLTSFGAAKILEWEAGTAILVLSCGWGILHVLLLPITFRALSGGAAPAK